MSNAEDDVYTMCIVKCHLVILFFDPLKDAYVFTEFPYLSFLCGQRWNFKELEQTPRLCEKSLVHLLWEYSLSLVVKLFLFSNIETMLIIFKSLK